MKNVIIPAALMCIVFEASAVNAPRCPPLNQHVNDSNNLILIEGTGKGAVKQVVVGSFGKDVDQQARLLSSFDRCGRLTQADFSFHQSEDDVKIEMVNHIEATSEGWEAAYDVTVTTQKGNDVVPLRVKQGRVQYRVGEQGNIISATDRFLLQGKEGLTTTTYHYTPQLLLSKSVARGSDPLTNGETRWQWNDKGLLVSGHSERREMRYHYDKQWRETRVTMEEKTVSGRNTTVDECQLWDEVGNCTLTYTRESEMLPGRTLMRNRGTAMKYTYWDQPDATN